jgi:hypothetical protein
VKRREPSLQAKALVVVNVVSVVIVAIAVAVVAVVVVPVEDVTEMSRNGFLPPSWVAW